MFNEEIIQKVWEKGRSVPNNNSNEWKKDECGAWIGRKYHGSRDSQYGWEIDHINPNGSDDIGNLRPLQWENNLSKSDGRLVCIITADGKENRYC